MNEEIKAQEASFKFNSYKISSFSFQDPQGEVEGISLSFSPSGVYVEDSRKFFLDLNFKAFYKNEELQVDIASASLNAIFTFKDEMPFEQIPEYFYVNSIAILFPYLRAFISTLTQLANIKQMILPIMRLDMLGDELKENTQKQ